MKTRKKLSSKWLGFGALLGMLAMYPAPTVHAQAPLCGGDAPPNSVTNAGTEFLLVFDQNEVQGYPNPEVSYQEIYIAALKDSATVTITSRGHVGVVKTYKLGPYEDVTYRIGNQEDYLIFSNEVVDDGAVHVVSTAPIVCYGLNHRLNTADAFIALPRQIAGTEYRVMSYYNSVPVAFTPMASEFSVAAFADSTDVTIIPTARTLSGKPAGSTLKFRLDSGQCVQIQASLSELLGDFSGSQVTSNKPVVVYGAHVRTEMPHNITDDAGNISRDHLTEAIPPISTWGKAFITSKTFTTRTGDVLRVQALNNGTSVTINGTPWVTLAADKFADTIINQPVIIETSGPALVGQYAQSAANARNGKGDPFFALVPPIEQTFNDLTFFASTDPVYQTGNYVMIVTESSGVGNITLDATPLPASAFTALPTAVGGKNYSIATVNIGGGAHRILSTNDAANGFTLLAFGVGMTTPNVVKMQNLLASNVYLDSAFVSIDGQRTSHIKMRERVAYDIGIISMGKVADLHLVPDATIDAPINAEVEIYYHCAAWAKMEPARTTMRIVPTAMAGVRPSGAKPQYLMENYPNPFSGSTTIEYALPERGDVTLRVYDALGRLVADYGTREENAGAHSVRLSGANLPAGQYVYELRSSKLNIQERRSMVIAK